MEFVVLVDENDTPIGEMEKLEAHQKGCLHRAISVFIFNQKNELLLQRRAMDKYHSAGLWTNTCCSHPRPEESSYDAAMRRLKEEMGIHTPLEHVFSFQYKTDFESGLIEHELDHVFIGFSDALPVLNPEEAMEYKYIDLTSLTNEIQSNPDDFTFWFKEILDRYNHQLIKHSENESL